MAQTQKQQCPVCTLLRLTKCQRQIVQRGLFSRTPKEAILAEPEFEFDFELEFEFVASTENAVLVCCAVHASYESDHESACLCWP